MPKRAPKSQPPLLADTDVHSSVDNLESQTVSSDESAIRPTTEEERQEFFLPVSGFVWFFPEEVRVINHPTFQRLGRIYQLGQAYNVYRGATHKRLEHALGTLHIVQRMIEAVDHNGRKKRNADKVRFLSLSEKRFIRLGALLHDIGHIVAGHTVEDELCLLGKHDADQRLDLIFEDPEWADREGRVLAEVIDSEYAKYVPEALKEKIKPSRIVRLLIRKQPIGIDKYGEVEELLKSCKDLQLEVCQFMIGNTICADLLDYLYRDWYHIGKPRPFDERILQYMEVRVGNPDKFVISLGRTPKIRTDAVSAILELLEWRYSLAESVLFHRTKLAAAAMLDRALFELWGESQEDVEKFLLPLSDEEMLSKCGEVAESGAAQKETARIAAALLKALERRQLFSHLSTRFYDDLPTRAAAIQRTYGGTEDPKEASRNRNRVLRVLEGDFDLPAGSLAMYCPGSVNAKIAMVQIAVNGDIAHFAEYEENHNNRLSGGHLTAQLQRFHRLWRVHFFIDSKVKKDLGERLHILQDAVNKLALGNLVDDEDNPYVSRSLAARLTEIPGSPWHGFKVGDSVSAAYQKAHTATGNYPFGASSISSFLEQPK